MHILKKNHDRVFTPGFTTASLITLFFLSVVLFNSCKKEYLDTPKQAKPAGSSIATANITIEEAKNFLGTLDLNALNTTAPDTITPFFIKIEPVWDKAVLSHAASGREIVIVPIADTTLMSNNGGKANAQLVFSKSGNDSIYAQILLTAATPAYHAANVDQYNLANFSGAFVFFDLHCNFQFGVVLDAGIPVSFVDSVGRAAGNSLDDRTLICTEYISIWQVCATWEMPLTVCTYKFTVYTSCNESPGSGGNGGGGGGGGGSVFAFTPEQQSQWAWLAPLIESGQLDYTAILFLGVPIHIFLYYGGELPPNFNLASYNQLLQLNDLCAFSDAQMDWVSNHASLVPLMLNLLNQHNNAPEWIEALKDVIDARIGGTHLFSWANMLKVIEMQVTLGLTESQLRWVIEQSRTDMQPKVVDQLFPFFELHQNDHSFLDALPIHIDLLMGSDNEYLLANQLAGFPEFGTEAWAGTINFSVEELPKTTAAEKLLAIAFPSQALIIYRNRTTAREKQRAFWGTDRNVTWLGKGDAFLHTYYQAINTQDVGSYITQLFSDAHETEHAAVLHLETEMDLFNNAIGIQLGSANPDADIHQMADIVHQNVLSGACVYLHPVDHILSPNYDLNCDYCLNGILPNTVVKPTNQ